MKFLFVSDVCTAGACLSPCVTFSDSEHCWRFERGTCLVAQFVASLVFELNNWLQMFRLSWIRPQNTSHLVWSRVAMCLLAVRTCHCWLLLCRKLTSSGQLHRDVLSNRNQKWHHVTAVYSSCLSGWIFSSRCPRVMWVRGRRTVLALHLWHHACFSDELNRFHCQCSDPTLVTCLLCVSRQSDGVGGSQHAAVLQTVRFGKSCTHAGDVALLLCSRQVSTGG